MFERRKDCNKFVVWIGKGERDFRAMEQVPYQEAEDGYNKLIHQYHDESLGIELNSGPLRFFTIRKFIPKSKITSIWIVQDD